MKKLKLTVLAMVAMMGVIFGGGSAWAEGEATMILSPMNQRVILTPGEEYRGSISISNAAAAKADLKYKLSIGSFMERAEEGGEDDYSVVDVDEVTTYNQIMEWITLDKQSGTVAPNGTDVVNFTIKVPLVAPAGGQYATIVVENTSDRNLSETGESGEGAGLMIEDTIRMVSIIYADVAGETHREGEILENKVPTFTFNNTVEATSLIQNSGNVHTDAEVLLQVWSAFGGENLCSTVDAGEEEPSTSFLLPDTKRLHKETCKLPSAGIYKVKQTVRIFGEESVVEGTLIYLPVWTILMIIFGTILIILWLVMMSTSRKKKMQSAQ